MITSSSYERDTILTTTIKNSIGSIGSSTPVLINSTSRFYILLSRGSFPSPRIFGSHLPASRSLHTSGSGCFSFLAYEKSLSGQQIVFNRADEAERAFGFSNNTSNIGSSRDPFSFKEFFKHRQPALQKRGSTQPFKTRNQQWRTHTECHSLTLTRL